MKFGEYHQIKGHLPALSIQQPWAWLIANGHKNLENREWRTNYRGPLLIHAGKSVDHHMFYAPSLHRYELYFPDAWKRTHPELEAVMPQNRYDYPTGGIVGMATLVDVVKESYLARSNPWFIGPYGFVLRDARPLPFTEYKGELGLFPVPESVLEAKQEDPFGEITAAMQRLEDEYKRKHPRQGTKPNFWQVPNAPVWVTIDKEMLAATVLECAHLGDFNGDWCKLELTKTVDGWDGPITRTWTHPKPIQSYKLKKRVV